MSQLLLLLLAAAPPTLAKPATLVREDVAPWRVSLRVGDHPEEQVSASPRFGAKAGWASAVDGDCNVFVVEPEVAGRPLPDLRARLVLHRAGTLDGGMVLASSTTGLSSPAVSPDGAHVLLVRGEDDLVRLNVHDGGELPLGQAWFAFWEADGTFETYSRTRAGCHVLRHFSADAGVDETVSRCEGFIVVPVGGGFLPHGAPLPILDRRLNVVGLLGFQEVELGAPVQLSVAERGLGCAQGVDFVSSDGGAVTIVKQARRWSMVVGSSCSPVDLRRGSVKVVQCSAR